MLSPLERYCEPVFREQLNYFLVVGCFKLNKLYFALICITLTKIIYPNVLLEKPKTVSSEEIEELAVNWETCFTWSFGRGCDFICTYREGKAGFLLQAFWLPVRSYNFSYYAAIKEFLKPQKTQNEYYFERPLVITGKMPVSLTSEKLCKLVKDKRFVCYTGAGMSAAGNVATMNNLQESLKLSNIKLMTNKLAFLKELVFNPSAITAAFDRFCKSAIESSPTLAHQALHRLAQHRSTAILTENVDLLQHRAGSKPVFTHSDEAHSIQPDDLKEIDALICIGLSRDDRGFIAYYKKHNPQGLLIAIDTHVPSYLSDEDYLLQEDLQKSLPYIEKCLCSQANESQSNSQIFMDLLCIH